MTSRFLADNRWLLRLCSNVARFVGLLIIFGTVLLAALELISLTTGATSSRLLATLPTQLSMFLLFVFYGVIALIFSEFLSYLLAAEGEPKWILRHGSKIIYAYALYSTVVTVCFVLRKPNAATAARIDFHQVLPFFVFSVTTIVKALIWIGIGIALQKVVAIVRESKTLV